MHPTPGEKNPGWFSAAKRAFPLLVILAAFIWACLTILTKRSAEAPSGATVIRIGHWQLEGGVRDGLEALAKEFSELPEVKARYGKVVIIQDAIPEGIYGQWITSQMMGQTAPDLVEVGVGLPPALWLTFQSRYFVPLTDIANQPNPFNKITQQDRDELSLLPPGQAQQRLAYFRELETTPLRMTFTDAMRSGYQEELQQYMRMPLSRFTIRLFYNKSLLEKLTGLNTPPPHLREFLALCKQISKIKTDKGDFYSPIASSPYNLRMWALGLFDPMTFGDLVQSDFNRDGTVGSDEMYAALRSGRLNFQNPGLRARFVMARQVMQYFQSGFTGLTRDDAVFAFAQQRSVFIPTGTWDAGSLIEQARGKFEIGVMGFPLPAPDDPEFGNLVVGPIYDGQGLGFPFGITRFAKHPDCAKDFLLFLASRRYNAELNKIIGWIPSVTGAPLPPLLEKFAPVNQGMYPNVNLDGLGGQTWTRYQQDYSKFESNSRFTYDQFVNSFSPFYKSAGMADWANQRRDWRHAILNGEITAGAMRGQAALKAPQSPQNPLWIQYRAYTISRQVFPELTSAVDEKLVRDGPSRPVDPYDFLPEAKAAIRRAYAARQTAPGK